MQSCCGTLLGSVLHRELYWTWAHLSWSMMRHQTWSTTGDIDSAYLAATSSKKATSASRCISMAAETTDMHCEASRAWHLFIWLHVQCMCCSEQHALCQVWLHGLRGYSSKALEGGQDPDEI